MQKLTEKSRKNVPNQNEGIEINTNGEVFSDRAETDVVTYVTRGCVSIDSKGTKYDNSAGLLNANSSRILNHTKNGNVRKDNKINARKSYRKWFVLGAGFSSYALIGGFVSSMSILYVEWLREFGKSNSETAVVQSVCSGTYYTAGIASGLSISKYGPRKCGMVGGIITTLGLVASCFASDIIFLTIYLGVSGFGFSLSYVSATVSVEMYFNGRLKVIALAFIVFGSGVGMSLYPVLYKVLLIEYGWRGTLLIVGGMMFNLVFNSYLCNSPTLGDSELKVNDTESLLQVRNDEFEDYPENNFQTISNSIAIKLHSKKDKGTKFVLTELLRQKLFVIFVVTMATAGTAFNSVKIFIIDYYVSVGISHSNAINIFLYFNVASTISRVFPGFIKQLPHLSVLFLPVLSTLLGCVSIASLSAIGSSYVLQVIAACCYGSGYGIYFTAIPVTATKLIDQDLYSVGFGLQMATIGVFSLMAGPISGYIRDVTGNYDVTFYSGSMVIFISGVSFLAIMVYRYFVSIRKS